MKNNVKRTQRGKNSPVNLTVASPYYEFSAYKTKQKEISHNHFLHHNLVEINPFSKAILLLKGQSVWRGETECPQSSLTSETPQGTAVTICFPHASDQWMKSRYSGVNYHRSHAEPLH